MRAILGVVLVALVMPIAFGDEHCRVWHESGAYDVCRNQFDSPVDGLSMLNMTDPRDDSRVRLVKFDGPIDDHQREALLGLDAEILDYLPRYAYVVRMEPDRDARAQRLPGVVSVIALPPALKIGRDVVASLAAESFAGSALHLQVSLWQGEHAAGHRDRMAALSGLDVVFSQRGPRAERLVVTVAAGRQAQIIDELARLDAVASIGIHREPVLLNSQGHWLHQSGASDSTPVFDHGIFGCGQTIAVLDSGVDFGHCSFVDPDSPIPPISACDEGADCPLASPDPGQRTTSLYYKWSFSDTDLGDAACDPGLNAGHGTHVAATAVGNRASSPADCEQGSTPGDQSDRDGAAPGAKLIAQEMGEGLEYLNQLGGSLYHAGSIAHAGGARIHNNSWGVPCFSNGLCNPGCTSYGALARDADFLAWDYPDLAIFVAAGNSGNSSCSEQVGAPANAKNVFSIGSNQRGAAGENVSGFSSRGPVIDGRIKPDLMAQGAAIRSAASSGDPETESCAVCTYSGTSMASPGAAGSAALVREYLARGFHPGGQENAADAIANPSSALIKAILINSARHLTGTGGGDGPNQSQGWGRITLDDSLYFEGDPRRLYLDESAQALGTGDVVEYRFEVEAGQPFKATLTWTDYPAMAGAGIHLVNRLRLEVEDPDGGVWTQKLADDDPDPFQSTSDSGFDNLNNVHQIRFDEPIAGEYRLRVRGVHVPMGGGQPYALAVSGDLEGSLVPTFTLAVEPEQLEVCVGDEAEFELELLGVAGFDDPVNLAIDEGLPAGAEAVFSPNPAIPADPAAPVSLTIDTDSVATGDYSLELSAESTALDHDAVLRSRDLQMQTVTPVLSTAELMAPADGANGVVLAPTLEWSAPDQASAYRLQMASDPDFDAIVVDQVLAETSYQPSMLDDDTSYYWRVASMNACGQGEFSEPASFNTLTQFCSTPDTVMPQGGSVSDLIAVEQSGYVGQVRVLLELSFDWPGDLVAELEHVDSEQQVDLLDRPGIPDGPFGQGCGTPDVAVILSDGYPSVQAIANCSVTAPGLQGVLAPAAPLATLIGLPVEGDWALTVADSQGLEPEGLLERWCVQLTIDPVSRILFRGRFEPSEP